MGGKFTVSWTEGGRHREGAVSSWFWAMRVARAVSRFADPGSVHVLAPGEARQ